MVISLGWAILFGAYVFTTKKATAASETVSTVKIAVVYPLSGALARNGNLCVQGAKAMMGWVNDNGGIKSLGGAKLVPVVADSTSTVEGAASAMERVLRDSSIKVAIGSWASSFTIASSEITERLGIPLFSGSYSDVLTERGFKWGFYTAPPNSAQMVLGWTKILEIAKEAGDVIKTAMLVGDNQAASKGAYEGCRKLFPSHGIKIIGEEIWAMGTLTDATPVMQKVKNLNPDVVVFVAGAISEAQMCLMKKKELGIATQFICSGGQVMDPSYLPIGAQNLEGMITVCATHPHKLTPPDFIKRSLDQCRKEYSNEPYCAQELSYDWGNIPVIAEILERAGSTNNQIFWKTARSIDLHDTISLNHFPKQGCAFDDKGRIAKKYQDVILVQWQGGAAVTVYPPHIAMAKPTWRKK